MTTQPGSISDLVPPSRANTHEEAKLPQRPKHGGQICEERPQMTWGPMRSFWASSHLKSLETVYKPRLPAERRLEQGPLSPQPCQDTWPW